MTNTKPMRHSKLLVSVPGLCLLLACGAKDPPPAASTPDVAATRPSPSVAPTDRWIGKWSGPEGTFLEILGGSGKYRITIRNLDGPRSFDGVGQGGRITFERDGASESLRAGSGAETGMKWLADKTDCLVVKAGEGYCRG